MQYFKIKKIDKSTGAEELSNQMYDEKTVKQALEDYRKTQYQYFFTEYPVQNSMKIETVKKEVVGFRSRQDFSFPNPMNGNQIVLVKKGDVLHLKKYFDNKDNIEKIGVAITGYNNFVIDFEIFKRGAISNFDAVENESC